VAVFLVTISTIKAHNLLLLFYKANIGSHFDTGNKVGVVVDDVAGCGMGGASLPASFIFIESSEHV